MNFGNFVYDYDIPEELLMQETMGKLELSPPTITRQNACNNLWMMNNNNQFAEIDFETTVYRTIEEEVAITNSSSENLNKRTSDDNNQFPTIKKIKTI